MNFMIDLETFSTRPGGVIASVGVCAFSKDKIHGTFYRVLDRQEQIDRGRIIDAGTLDWWLRQNDKARGALLGVKTTAADFHKDLNDFITSFGPNSDALVWSNGAAFDIPFLEDYLKNFGFQAPWLYLNARCFRTYNALTKCSDLMTDEDNEGTHHNAVDDAVWQAKAMIRFMNRRK